MSATATAESAKLGSTTVRVPRAIRVAGLLTMHAAFVVGAQLLVFALAGYEARNVRALLLAAPVITPLFLAAFAYHLVYEREPYDTYTECLRVVARATFAGAITGMAAMYAIGAAAYPRSAYVIAVPLILASVYLSEAVRLHRRLHRRPPRRAVVLGPDKYARPLLDHFEQQPTASLAIVDHLDVPDLLARLGDDPHPPYDIVLIPGPGQLRYTPGRLLLAARGRGMRIFMLAGEAGAFLGLSDLHELGGLPWHELRVQSLPAPRRAMKRLTDLVLVVVAAPFALLAGLAVALAVRAESGGPALHRQQRLGRGDRPFTMVKFRTMTNGAESDGAARLADAHDRRVTRVGRFLRRHRLDELPQLWHVLTGDMSLVGPRPERPELAAGFEASVPGYGDRHSMRPGITGLAQVLGAYDTPAEHKVRYDMLYVANWSVWLDVQILLKTAAVVVRGTGAR